MGHSSGVAVARVRPGSRVGTIQIKTVKIKTLLLASVLCVLSVASAPAQISNLLTNAPASSFFGSVGSYLTGSNPNLTIRGSAEITLGMAYQAGVNIASDFGIRYKFGTPATNGSASGLFVESVTRNAGVAGIIVSEQAGGGYYLIPASTPDIELSGGLLAGYRFDTASPAITAYLDVRKSLTVNTYAGIRIGYEWDSARQRAQAAPVISAETGFTF